MGPGGVFGDVLGGSSLDSPVTVVASAPCEVLLFPYEKLLQPDGSAARQRLLQNLVRTISDKYFLLSRRVDLLVMKTLRAKVCAYLLSEAEQQGSMTFTIPFSRIQLADYLNCDRSALSRELSLMQLQAAGAGGSAADDIINLSVSLRSPAPLIREPLAGRASPSISPAAPKAFGPCCFG